MSKADWISIICHWISNINIASYYYIVISIIHSIEQDGQLRSQEDHSKIEAKQGLKCIKRRTEDIQREWEDYIRTVLI